MSPKTRASSPFAVDKTPLAGLGSALSMDTDPTDGPAALAHSAGTTGGPGLFQRSEKFANAAVFLLWFTIAAVVYGAFVRGSLSGDGCGAYWPQCGPGLVPDGSSTKAVIEFTHRLSTALLGLFTVGLYVWSRKLFPVKTPARTAAGWSLFFVVTEGGLGIILVLMKWVARDQSMARLFTMPLHLVNTFSLLLSLSLAAYLAKTGLRVTMAGQGGVGSAVKWALGSFVFLGMTGAVSAMGKTAYEAELALARTFDQRVAMHVGENAPVALRGGAMHPFVAISAGLLLVLAVRLVMERRGHLAGVKEWGGWTIGLFVGQLVLGIANLVMSAPLTMQLIHLGLAVVNWVTLSMLLAVSMRPEEAVPAEEPEAAVPASAPMGLRETVRQYVALTKPRVISLLLFTTVAAMFMAQQGWPGLSLVIIVCLGGYMAAGSANTYNMVIERDLDVAMERTSHRPTVTHTISNKAALIFATVLGLGSFGLLWFGANPLAAWMAMCGLLTYVFVYTLWLKRRTWQNIVIGGAAGAFPPLVGWAAVTGNLSPLAWFLFALVFTWTPVHFWALAMLIKEDYAKAGVPMLPVVHGDRMTVLQIALYAVITTILCAVPLWFGQVGMVYLAGAGLLNLGLLIQSFQLLRETTKARARSLFKFSMVYLALIFVVMVVDRVVAA